MQPVEEMNQTDESHDRATERRNFFLSTLLKIDPNGALTARVRNLSAGGMMIELAEEPDPELVLGQRLVAELRNVGRIKGEIAWIGGRRFGIKFDREIDPELARKPHVAGEGTPDYVKPVLVKDRSMRALKSESGW